MIAAECHDQANALRLGQTTYQLRSVEALGGVNLSGVLTALTFYKQRYIERGWFAEGFNTADVQDAEALRDACAGCH